MKIAGGAKGTGGAPGTGGRVIEFGAGEGIIAFFPSPRHQDLATRQQGDHRVPHQLSLADNDFANLFFDRSSGCAECFGRDLNI